jgi:hypothetical protein
MSNESREESIAGSRERLRRTRAEIVGSLQRLSPARRKRSDAFPRSAIMRAALGHNGRLVLGGAAVTLALLRPRLLPMAMGAARLAPWIPVVSNLLNRYVVRRNGTDDR